MLNVVQDICQKIEALRHPVTLTQTSTSNLANMISWIRLPLLLTVGVAITAASSFSNLINVKSSVDEHNPDCIDTSHFQDTMLSLSSCLSGCVELHSAFVNVDNDEVRMNTETYNTTAAITTSSSRKSPGSMKAAALLLLFILAFATMEAHQLIIVMTMLLVSGGLSTDVVIGFFGAWLVIYLGMLKQTEQGEDGYDIEKDMYYDCSEEETQSSFGLTWNGKKFKWVDI